MRNVFLMIAMLAITAACNDVSVEWVSSTYESPWKVMEMASGTDVGKVIEIDTGKTLHEIEGFGTCFNELGWASLLDLTPEERDGILNELFTPSGANFTLARMPIAANDFSLDYYSYAPVAEDFELKSFSVAHDEDYLIPFIKAAQEINPDLKIWASPWCPPSWMKVNRHYANAASCGNGLSEDKQIPEGVDAFILDERYLDCYARYFGMFIDAYRTYGIDIHMVMPQNEPNSDQCFPACTWTPFGLAQFIKHLGPEMDKRDVEVYLGTMERADPELWEYILKDPEASSISKEWDSNGLERTLFLYCTKGIRIFLANRRSRNAGTD